MRTVTIVAQIPHLPAPLAYARLTDFGAYPAHSESVRSVVVTEVTGNVTLSRWEVDFRNGILRWTEEDTFDRAELRITFAQLEGDIAAFDGSWHCADAPGGTQVTFEARLDLGIPTLADVLEPIAVRALTDNTASILRGLFGAGIAIEAASAAAALA